MHSYALFVCTASDLLKVSALHKACSACCLSGLWGCPARQGCIRALFLCLVMLMCVPLVPDAADQGNVWGFARMDVRFWGLQQQPPKEAGNQQQHSPKQLQELLHKQQVYPVGCHHWHWVWSAM